MPKLRVHNFSISLDGYSARPNQSIDHPFGDGDPEFLHDWMFATRTWRKMVGEDRGEEGLDDDMAAAFFTGKGATIIGRNMFGPVRGEWGDSDWKGWWGEEPPYHCPVFVLTHHAREPIPMAGGTTFHFVTDGIESAYAQAREVAGDRPISIAGGAWCGR